MPLVTENRVGRLGAPMGYIMSGMSTAPEQKQKKLFSILHSMDRVMVAYSGGTDSAYLAWAAGRVLVIARLP